MGFEEETGRPECARGQAAGITPERERGPRIGAGRPSPGSIQPGNSESSVPNCFAMTSGESLPGTTGARSRMANGIMTSRGVYSETAEGWLGPKGILRQQAARRARSPRPGQRERHELCVFVRPGADDDVLLAAV